MDKIIRNRIRCKACGEIIESTQEKMFARCSCGCCTVDGGLTRLKRTFANTPNDYDEMSEFVLPEDITE